MRKLLISLSLLIPFLAFGQHGKDRDTSIGTHMSGYIYKGDTTIVIQGGYYLHIKIKEGKKVRDEYIDVTNQELDRITRRWKYVFIIEGEL